MQEEKCGHYIPVEIKAFSSIDTKRAKLFMSDLKRFDDRDQNRDRYPAEKCTPLSICIETFCKSR
jgi:hypothetical protein